MLATAACGSDGTSSNADTAAPDASTPTTPARDVVFSLGDGIGMTIMTVTCIYKVGEDDELTVDTLPETGFVWAFSNNAQVADSVPSISAYMTGMKVNGEIISMSPGTMAYDTGDKDYLSGADSICPSDSGKPIATLLELMKAAGYGTGVVTATHVMHVIPAATYSHIYHHDDENTIAARLIPADKGFNAALSDGVDVIFGGGRRHFQSTTAGGAHTDGRDLITELKTGGYRYISNKVEFDTLQATSGKVVGLFTSSHMSYDLDRNPNREPSLGEVTNKAIDALVAKKRGSFLMVEGSRIGHALHEAAARKALQDTVAFGSATRGAVDRLNTIDPGLKNTLIVVTADHDHTLVLSGYAKRTGPTSDSNSGMLGLLENYVTGANATDMGGNPFTIIGFDTGENRPTTRGALIDTAVYDKNHHQEVVIPVAPNSETHGGTGVFIGACDLGTERFTDTMDNTKVFGLIKQAMGL